MRRGITMLTAAGTVTLALALVLALAGPARAKGIQSATITGPGLDEPIDVPPAGGDGGDLAALTAFWEVMPGQPLPPTFTDETPAGRLGPRYAVTWHIMTGPEETTTIRQDLYPYADGGPLVHTDAGQAIFNGTTVGGWYWAPIALRGRLRALGVPAADSTPAAAKSSAASPQGAGAPSSDDSPWPVVIGAVAGAMALAGVGGAMAVRRTRRRERLAPVPL